MSVNPFVQLLADFRAAWAEMQHGEEMLEIQFVSMSTPVLNEYLNRDEREVVCTCNLPVEEGNTVGHVWYVVALPKKTERLATYSKRFIDLASAAGAALPVSLRDAIVDYCPWTAGHAASWWFALLYALFEAPHVKHFRPDIWIHRPHFLSVTAIEMCRLHTEHPVFPTPTEKPEQGEENSGADKTPRGVRSTKPAGRTSKRGRPVVQTTTQRAEFAKQLRKQGETWEGIAAAYAKKYPKDIDASADAIRLAFQRQYPEQK